MIRDRVTFRVAYAPTETKNSSNTHEFCTTSDRAVKGVPIHEQLSVLMDAHARKGRRKKGVGLSKYNNSNLGAYDRNPLNENLS